MKKTCVLLLYLTFTALSSPAQAIQDPRTDIIVYRLPDPERVYVYRGSSGSVVYDARIPPNAIINNTFILPENVNPDTLTIAQSGKRIFSYSTQVVEALVVLKSGERPSLVRILQVDVRSITPGAPLEVKYSIRNSGLTWDAVLDLEIKDQGSLECTLLAVVRTDRELPGVTQSILSKRPEIILMSSRNVLLDDKDSVFNIGKVEIEANKRTMFILEEGRTAYSLVYSWDANRVERPHAYLRAATPLKTMAGEVQVYLNASGINITSGRYLVSPDTSFEFSIGDEPNIATYRSAVTTEHLERANVPYTHNLEYTVTNKLDKTVLFEISVPVSFGKKFRTQYHFTKDPDERPGDRMIWKYTLKPGQEEKLQFSYDHESKDDPFYYNFEHYSNGR